MELRQIRYFLSVAETEHLTQSAEALFITQSTLSHGLRQLETELGTPLFDRLGRGLKLSQAGVAFRSYAARALQELDAGRMALADMAGLQSGTLTVGVIPTFLTLFIPDVVAAFSAAYPGVRVMVRDQRSGQIEEQLISGQLDVGIAFHPASREEIEAEAVQKLPRRLRKGLVDDGRWLSPESRAQLQAWIDASPRVQALVEHRRRLAAVLEARSANAADSLHRLQEWCREAEASGIRSLQEFATRLRGYALQPA